MLVNLAHPGGRRRIFWRKFVFFGKTEKIVWFFDEKFLPVKNSAGEESINFL